MANGISLVFIKIQSKIILLFLIPLLLTSGWIGWRSFVMIENAVTDHAGYLMRTQLNQVAQTIAEYYEESRRDMLMAMENTIFTEYFSLPETRAGNRYDQQGKLLLTQRQNELREHIELWVSAVQKRYPIVESCLVDQSGQEHMRITFGKIAPVEEFSKNEEYHEFFTKAFQLNKGDVYLAEPYLSDDADKWVFAFISPLVLENTGEKIAYFHYEIPVALIQEMITNSAWQSSTDPTTPKGSNQPQLNRFFVMNGSGRIVADSQHAVNLNQKFQTSSKENYTFSSVLPPSSLISSHHDFLAMTETMRMGEIGFGSFEENGVRYFLAFRPLPIFDWRIGYLKPYHALLEGASSLDLIKTDILITAMVTLLVVGTMVWLVTRRITKPVQHLAATASQVANGQLDARFAVNFPRDEIGILAGHLEEMRQRLRNYQLDLEQIVEQRTTSLSETNQQLMVTIQELNNTREELIQSAKMASLGRLVAGFAHEINTPMGIAIGSISHLPEIATELAQALARDEVDGAWLDRTLSKLQESSNLCMINLRKAADIVSRFKRTTVDQTSDTERLFNVREVMEDVVLSLHNRFKNKPIQIHIQADDDLEVLNHPGAIGQILTNWLLNSLIHGFDDGVRAGHIIIDAQLDHFSQRLKIHYQDDGKGMSAETLKRVYEPFFTTARQFGGSGLGMFICYNIVRTQLNGTINCGSHPEEGIAIQVEFPVKFFDGKQSLAIN